MREQQQELQALDEEKASLGAEKAGLDALVESLRTQLAALQVRESSPSGRKHPHHPCHCLASFGFSHVVFSLAYFSCPRLLSALHLTYSMLMLMIFVVFYPCLRVCDFVS